jgi:predicted HTH transcriptional regulator
MANVRDGGTILIGVVDETFAREGIDARTTTKRP